VIHIAAGSAHSIALRNDGSVVAWGDDGSSRCDVPEGLSNVTQVAAGSAHSLARSSDGSIVAWGDNGSGQCDVPEGLVNVTQVAAGSAHSLALRNDGSVVAWGDNGSSQCDVPEGLLNVTQVAAGGAHAPLPIQLGSFTAKNVSGQYVCLEWTTVSEVNNYGFEVQCSQDALNNFQTLPNSFIAGHGTTIEPQQYSYTDVTVTLTTRAYRLKQIDLDGTVHFTEPMRVEVFTDIKNESLPTGFSLGPNYPNPFNPSTTIRYGLPNKSRVTLTVLNTLGQQVTSLVNREVDAGYHEVKFDGHGLSSGVYFYRILAGDFVQTRKFVLLK
jgi:hypothetical protein